MSTTTYKHLALVTAAAAAFLAGCTDTNDDAGSRNEPSGPQKTEQRPTSKGPVDRATACLEEVGFEAKRDNAETTTVYDGGGDVVAAIQTFKSEKAARSFVKEGLATRPAVFGRYVFEFRLGIESDTEMRVVRDCANRLES